MAPVKAFWLSGLSKVRSATPSSTSKRRSAMSRILTCPRTCARGLRKTKRPSSGKEEGRWFVPDSRPGIRVLGLVLHPIPAEHHEADHTRAEQEQEPRLRDEVDQELGDGRDLDV